MTTYDEPFGAARTSRKAGDRGHRSAHRRFKPTASHRLLENKTRPLTPASDHRSRLLAEPWSFPGRPRASAAEGDRDRCRVTGELRPHRAPARRKGAGTRTGRRAPEERRWRFHDLDTTTAREAFHGTSHQHERVLDDPRSGTSRTSASDWAVTSPDSPPVFASRRPPTTPPASVSLSACARRSSRSAPPGGTLRTASASPRRRKPRSPR